MSSSMRSQLEEIRRNQFGQIPRVRLVGRTLLRTVNGSKTSAPDISREILSWASGKWPGLIPKTAFQGESFEKVQAGLNLSVSHLPEAGLWACRFEHLGTEAARTWVTEAVVAQLDDFAVLGVVNLTSSTSEESVPLSMPRFVRDLVKTGNFKDGGVALGLKPIVWSGPDSAIEFVKLLTSSERQLPIIAISKKFDETTYVSADTLARELVGLAHVVVLGGDASKRVGDAIGFDWTVYNGAVRSYYPDFSLDGDSSRHPLATSHRIEAFEDDEGVGPDAFSRWLRRRTYEFSVSPSNRYTEFPDYLSVRTTSLKKVSKSGDVMARVAALEEQNQLLQTKVQEWMDLAVTHSEGEDAARQQLAQARAHNDALQVALEGLRSKASRAVVVYPSKLDQIAAWVSANFAGRLYFHPRAQRTLKKGQYEDVVTLAKALELLANEYRNIRVGSTSTSDSDKTAFEEKTKLLGLELSRSISKTGVGEFENDYYVDYSIGQSKKQLLEWHLSKGDARDERRCLRIYFFWDAESKLVVVGSLPGHLTNRLT